MKERNGDDNIGHTSKLLFATKFLDKSFVLKFRDELETKTNNKYVICIITLNIGDIIE